MRSIIKPTILLNVLAPFALMCFASCTDEAAEPSSEDSSELQIGASFYDGATQCSAGGATMHCCPSGSVMIGANVDRNTFKCGQLATGSIRFLDIATQRNGMHACPLGSVMVGMHVGQNWLVCQYPATTTLFEYVDGSTQDPFPMHKCADGTAMAGINVGANQFSCDF